MNLASLIASFSTAASYAVTRTARGSVSYGEVSHGSQTTFTILGTAFPASSKDMQRLPEGRIVTDARRLISATELYNGGQEFAYEADIVVIDGDQFEVEHIDVWTDSASRTTAYSYILTRVNT